MPSFSFLHAADLHLDGPFHGLTASPASPSGILDTVCESSFEAFDRLIKLALEKKVRFVLFAGDIYDGQDRSLRAQLRFLDGLKRLSDAGIQSFIVHGNHDPLDDWAPTLEWPSGARRFGVELETEVIEWDGAPRVAVTGISHAQRHEFRNLAQMFKRSDDNLFHIGLLHANAGNDTGHEPVAPCSVQDLLEAGQDYWALGHVHSHQCLNRAPCIVYPGALQGSCLRETGPHGCAVVQVEDHGVDVQFHALDTVRWAEIELSIQNLDSIDRLENAMTQRIDATLSEMGERALIGHLTLRGRGRLYAELRKPGVASELLGRIRAAYRNAPSPIWIENLNVACRPDIDLESRREAGDFLAQVLRQAAALRNEDLPLSKKLAPVLQDLNAALQARSIPDPFNEPGLADILDESERLCLDALEVDE